MGSHLQLILLQEESPSGPEVAEYMHLLHPNSGHMNHCHDLLWRHREAQASSGSFNMQKQPLARRDEEVKPFCNSKPLLRSTP